jgi:protein ImuB
VLAPRLERVNLGSGVEEMIVYAARSAPLHDRQSAFWPEAAGASSPAAIAELVDQLTARLGSHAVTEIAPVETVLPEEAFVHSPIERIQPKKHGAPAVKVTPADRPSQLFDRPEPAHVLSIVPDGPPRRITWRGHASEVIAARGPERLETPWWRPRDQSGRVRSSGTVPVSPRTSSTSDSGIDTATSNARRNGDCPFLPELLTHPLSGRDYFEIEDEHGRRLWVYRELRSNRWFVHGQW